MSRGPQWLQRKCAYVGKKMSGALPVYRRYLPVKIVTPSEIIDIILPEILRNLEEVVKEGRGKQISHLPSSLSPRSQITVH
jgi:hypothetical protein